MYNMQELGTLIDRAISMLPTQLRGDAPLKWQNGPGPRDMCQAHPVMRGWTTTLPLRHQGVLVSALRGADGAPKEDPSKSITSTIRRAVMNPADDRETTAAGGFFGFSAAKLTQNTHAFLHSMDQYPLHYVTHLMHAAQIIGYKHPSDDFRTYFELLYTMMVCKFHLLPEDVQTMDARLTEDRVQAGTVERDYTPGDGLRIKLPDYTEKHAFADMADPAHRSFIGNS